MIWKEIPSTLDQCPERHISAARFWERDFGGAGDAGNPSPSPLMRWTWVHS